MKIVIIGNGIAGTTAARFIRKKSDCEITMISSESSYPFSRTALMYLYMGHMTFDHIKLYEDDFWQKNSIKLLKEKVIGIQTSNKKIDLASGIAITYDKLIIATGSISNKFGWPGQELENVNGLYHIDDLNKMEIASQDGIQRAVIVGGGLIGIEMAEMFHSRKIPVCMLVREASFWNTVLPAEESAMINQHIRAHGIDLRLNSELKKIEGHQGKVTSVKIKNGDQIACQYVGLTVGVSPNIDFIKNSNLAYHKGILVNEYLQTSVNDIYAIGDCAELKIHEHGRRPIEAVWYTARAMGEIAAMNICEGPNRYEQGIWFNSAKFFDIEYQVYGYVPATEDLDVDSLFWQHADHAKSIRLVFHKKEKHIIGVNLLGIRYRQEVCEKWIKHKCHIEDVLSNLSLANFDPEFFEAYESEIVKIYNDKFGKALIASSCRKLNRVKIFLESFK